MAYSDYVPVIGTIINISRGNDCCSQRMSLRTENGIVNFMVDSQTQVIDSRQLRPGMQVAAFYDSSLPVPLIFPPQYMAKIITVIGRNEQVMLNFLTGICLQRTGPYSSISLEIPFLTPSTGKALLVTRGGIPFWFIIP